MADGATFVSYTNFPTGGLVAGGTAAIGVTFSNNGTTTWTASGNIRMGYEPKNSTTNNCLWQSAQSSIRVLLDSSDTIGPGQSKTFTANITAPPASGTYIFQCTMVHDGVAWFGSTSTASSIVVSHNSTLKTVVLTAGTTGWTVPADFNRSCNDVKCLGPGGQGFGDVGSNGGGGGGAYARMPNMNLTPGTTYNCQVGSGSSENDTWLNTTSAIIADAGKNAVDTSGAAGGTTASSIGLYEAAGGAGGAGSSGGGGGGGAGGPNGTGNAGATGTPTGGAGGSGDAGSGGAGGPGGTTGNGTAGSAGTNFGSGYGPGGGGGGAGTSNDSGGNGGAYGGGGGGASGVGGPGIGGHGLIFIIYVPVPLNNRNFMTGNVNKRMGGGFM